MTQTLRCLAYGYRWGPVGVHPFVPDGPFQAFLLCLDCRKPQAQVLLPGELPRCTHCASARIEGLTRCPDCDTGDLSWS